MYDDKFKEATKSLMSYCKEHMGYEEDPDVHYVTDSDNANNMLGYTAHYQPEKRIVTIYISNRHPKDALRSLSHELVHHAQNCRGDLSGDSPTEEGYAQNDPHMRDMEEEAYLKGNMMFRDWEDSCKAQNTILTPNIGENKMKLLENMIKEKIIKILNEKKMPDANKDGVPDFAQDGKGANDLGKGKSKPKNKPKKGKIPPQLAKKSDEEGEEKVEEGGAAQRRGNEDRLRRQEPDRIKEEDEIDENLTEAKCPHCDGDAPKSKCNCKGLKDKSYDGDERPNFSIGSLEESKKSELTDIKKKQNSIKSLNETRLLNINKELTRRLLK